MVNGLRQRGTRRCLVRSAFLLLHSAARDTYWSVATLWLGVQAF